MGERKSDCRYNCGDYNPNRYLNDITSCYHCCLSTYALTRVYSQMLCCEHAVTAPMLLQFYFIFFSLNSLPVLLLSVFGVVAIVISVYASTYA